MSKRKSTIPKTNLYNQLDIFRWDTANRVFDQMNDGLYWSGWEMIVDKVNRVTPESINADCIGDIMYILSLK